MIYKHVFWDFDGTLFDTYAVRAKVMSDMLAERYGVSESEADIKERMLVTMGHAIDFFSGKHNLGPEFEARFKDMAAKLEMERAEPFEGIPELLKSIYNKSGGNYIYTHRGDSTFALLDKYNLSRYFTDHITKKDNFPRKPSPEALLSMLDKHGIAKADAIMVGDREIDILAAKNAGIASCMLIYGNGPGARLAGTVSADFTVFGSNELNSALFGFML